IKDLSWLKGYCPVCGSWPEISFWKGSEGRRFLKCSFCSHEWSFMRTQCPFCENTDNEKIEIIFSEDRNFEHAELCQECMKYIVGIDTRNMIAVPHAYVAPLGLIYLDVLAQDKGFQPGAACVWNMLEKTEKSL
ncbi:MAG: formate dehydrogenase accessory protein FdhE, partial [Pseudomonadota bacterium]